MSETYSCCLIGANSDESDANLCTASLLSVFWQRDQNSLTLWWWSRANIQYLREFLLSQLCQTPLYETTFLSGFALLQLCCMCRLIVILFILMLTSGYLFWCWLFIFLIFCRVFLTGTCVAAVYISLVADRFWWEQLDYHYGTKHGNCYEIVEPLIQTIIYSLLQQFIIISYQLFSHISLKNYFSVSYMMCPIGKSFSSMPF